MGFSICSRIVALGLAVCTFTSGALAQTGPTAGDHTLPAFPAPPSSEPPPQENPASPSGTPIPSSGAGDGYSYAPSEYEGFSVVYPTDGTEPLYVSDGFLQTSIKSSSNGSQVVSDAKAYQKMNAQVASQLQEQFYPDASAGDANVQRSVIEGADRDVIIEQDPKAGPYARVTVTDKDGNVISESSLSASMAKQVMENPYMDAEKKIEGLGKIQFKLPEKARDNFNQLSPEQLREIVLEDPAVQKQEFVKFARVMAQVEKKKKALHDGAEATTQTDGANADEHKSVEDGTANRSQRQTHERDVAMEKMDTVRENGPDTNRHSNGGEALRSKGELGAPEIAGIALGILAIGIFVFGWWKARQ